MGRISGSVATEIKGETGQYTSISFGSFFRLPIRFQPPGSRHYSLLPIFLMKVMTGVHQYLHAMFSGQ